MSFTSYTFFIFLPVVLLFYFLMPRRLRTVWALAASLIFYMSFQPRYVFVLLFAALLSYFTGLGLEGLQKTAAAGEGTERRKKLLLWSGIGIVLFILVFFKYNKYFPLPFSFALPLGISYFTLQIVAYLVDIYKGKIRAERNIIEYALFLSFFPKMIAGPIERSQNFMGQIKDCRNWNLFDGRRITEGFSLVVWGYFQKLVIGDRMALLIREVFDNYMLYGFVELFLGALFFLIQIYVDFLGYMNIAMGVSKIMGFRLQENFNAPYFACSVKEYWSRWHLTLSAWLKEYIYIPLGGNRKGRARKYVNILITFFVSGMWHGASWNYVLWGGLQGVYQILEDAFAPVADKINKRLHTKTDSFSYRLLQYVRTWFLVLLGLVFFNSPTAPDAFRYLGRMFTRWNPWALFDGTIYTLGLNEKSFHVVAAGLVLFFLADWMKYKQNERIDTWLSRQCIWFRWSVWIVLLLSTVILGAYGPSYDAGNFVYFGF